MRVESMLPARAAIVRIRSSTLTASASTSPGSSPDATSVYGWLKIVTRTESGRGIGGSLRAAEQVHLREELFDAGADLAAFAAQLFDLLRQALDFASRRCCLGLRGAGLVALGDRVFKLRLERLFFAAQPGHKLDGARDALLQAGERVERFGRFRCCRCHFELCSRLLCGCVGRFCRLDQRVEGGLVGGGEVG